MTDELRAQGFDPGNNKFTRYNDVSLDLGGPILRDKLWFYAAYGYNYSGLLIPGFAVAMGWLFLLHPRIGIVNQFLQDAFGFIDAPLSITTSVLRTREQLVFDWAARIGAPVAWVLAGGYRGPEFEMDDVVALHRLTVEAAA